MFGHIHRWTGTPMNGVEWSGPGHGPGTCSMHISPTSCTMANTHPNRQTRTLSPRVLQFRESCSPGVLEPCSY
uniref:HDC19177 n=1 Tax=Drosophila melanogaster TaxID=7227 RepID=Q6IIA6_DROME|nr:TPA_inf: HDC19177 [Drosophila melanogaster]